MQLINSGLATFFHLQDQERKYSVQFQPLDLIRYVSFLSSLLHLL
jgi:hypothetical protein